jgi:hypothetical protein
MVSITCDNCGAKRADTSSGEPLSSPWILGHDFETESTTALQRSIRFLDRWDDRRAMEFGAIHLCCTDCRDEYMAKSRQAA